ncbi:MAG: toll/interleukin-1 receptor domain-containing protein [Bryobacteraceae bacterium]
MATIFISYRREDSAGYTGRLCDRLNGIFGKDRVFMDVEDIRPGQNFAQTIEERIAACDAMVVVIGPLWMAHMQRRLDDGEDFVRQEVEAALKRGITVVPVLVGGAPMPQVADLPNSLAALSRHQVLELADARFDEDVARLSKALGREERWKLWKILVPALAAFLALAVFLLTRTAGVDINGRWLAEMQKERQPPYRIRLTFEVMGDRVTGSVVYPTGEGGIHEGKIAGGRLSFYTRHVPQFASEPATIRFEGEIRNKEIHLTSTDDFGFAKGVAKRAGP